MNSFISEMPGPAVGVNARAPAHAAPITMPIAASSSSACRIAKRFFLVSGSRAVLLAEALERLHQRRRRRDRIPGADGRAGVEAAERRRRCCRRSGSSPSSRPSARGGSAAGSRSAPWRSRSRGRPPSGSSPSAPASAPNFSLSSARMIVGVHVEQRRQRAGVGDVLHQDALAHALERRVAHLGQRNAEVGDVGPLQPLVERPRSSRRAASRRLAPRRRPWRRSRG